MAREPESAAGPRSAIEALACPRCHAHLEPDAGALRCVACGVAFAARGGVWDMAPELELQPGLAQRFMEDRGVVRIYETRFRPAITRLVSSLRYADEERYLERWLSAMDGPVLDLACGTGRYTRWLARRLGVARVVGLDLSRPMLAEARERASGEGLGELLFVRGNALALPFDDGSLGAIHSFGALHLFPDVPRALSEIARVLRPGSSFTCLTTGLASDPVRRIAQRTFTRMVTLRFFDPSELRAQVEEAGLEALDVTQSGLMLLLAARRR